MNKNKTITLIIIFCFLAYLMEIEKKVRCVMTSQFTEITAIIHSPKSDNIFFSSYISETFPD